MKKISTLFLSALLSGSLFAQTHHVHITIDTKAFPNVDCAANATLSGVVPPEKLYLHSGLCTSSAADCFNNVTVINSTVWQHVVGNWQDLNGDGTSECPDDGVGLMNYDGDGIWSIDLILENYFTDPNKVYNGNTGSGPSTVWNTTTQPTPFTMGYVFRTSLNGVCTKGADLGPNNACMDYFIGNLDGTPGFINPGVNPPQTNYNPPGASFTTGIEEPNIIYRHQISPNPVQESTTISFFLTTYQPKFSVKIYDATGNLIKILNDSALPAGDRNITWDRTNESGDRVANGVYYFVMQSQNSIVTDKLVVIE
jgi:FlgD Ig-like domain